jgi:periplasmic protein TonB
MMNRMLIPENQPGTAHVRAHVPLGPPRVPDARDTFDGALLDTAVKGRNLLDWFAAMAFEIALVAALLAIPIFFTHSNKLADFGSTTVIAPPPIFAPPPPPAAGIAHQAVRSPEIKISQAKLTMPISIPKAIAMPHPEAATPSENIPDLSADIPGGVPGGIIGGVPGGVLGGILGGTGLAAPPPPPIAAASNGPLHVGGEVKEPRAIFTPQPDYPRLALQARIQGVVKIDATIDKNGNVVEARAIDGPPLLISAALNAVEQWKYQPTYLNGVPWPVELTINVNFHAS